MPKQIQKNEPPADTDGFIDRAELARRLGISIGTVHNHCKAGLLPHVKLGHFIRFDWALVKQTLLRQMRGGLQ